MGIDLEKLKQGRQRNPNRRSLKTSNVYIKLLYKIYSFLARRTDSCFNNTIQKRLMMSRVNRPVMSLSRLAKLMKNHQNKTAVVIGTVTHDTRTPFISSPFPNIKIAALRVTNTAKAFLSLAGCEVMTLDQLAISNPTGSNCVLLRGGKNREAQRHFFNKNDHPKPHVLSKGAKFEKQRMRR